MRVGKYADPRSSNSLSVSYLSATLVTSPETCSM